MASGNQSSPAPLRIGALDVGTNTVLMLVAEITDGKKVRAVQEFSRITRLGRGVDRTGRLDPEASARTIDAIVEFVNGARALGANRIVTAATSALRDAADGDAFVTKVKKDTGVELDIVSGDAEAQLSYLAVKHGLPIDPKKNLLIVDIGGGSTEFIFVPSAYAASADRPCSLATAGEPGLSTANRSGEIQTTSLQIGSVRLTERFVRNDPPSAEEIRQLRASIDEAISKLSSWTRAADLLVGIAGTVTTICAVATEMRTYDPAQVHGYELSQTQVDAVVEKLTRIPTAERKKLPGMVEGRADVIVAGGLILERIVRSCNAQSLIVSDQGIRWGLVYREVERLSAP
jgi:exopolyphosphatase/guanosine-5'-triphosphate,3'-diphosphate pyrophosphatase